MRGLVIGIAVAAFGIWRWRSKRRRPLASESFARMRTDRDEPSRLFGLEERLYERL